jgi:DNA invertase Pin-like site-specific DNA recombinase
MPSEANPRIRCAIYTRKSSEEGLEQSFNSLDAQREACRAFITSQKHEGWRPHGTVDDDGGFSGSNLDRPALRRLFEDIKEKKIDTVVVYKVDWLTRSLADFAKIVEIFDTHKVSFVSVTQQFNTTTSMGRLTLNVLLSFAQFEREVTGERIRDKIAASKRKGMWMGGTVPLGYDLRARKLVINDYEAERIREIFSGYLRLGCVSKLRTFLDSKSMKTKERISQTGHKIGGNSYSRGALYNILQNRIYLGEIEHRGDIHKGEHEGIVSREVWERVQAQMRANKNSHHDGLRASAPSLLVGLLYDDRGNRFTPAHAVKNGKRYRYYVSQAAIKNPGTSHLGLARIPAGEIESLVCSRLRSFLSSIHDVVDALAPQKTSAVATQGVLAAAQKLSKRLDSALSTEKRLLVGSFISRIVVHPESVDLLLNQQSLWNAFTDGHSIKTNRAEPQNGFLSLNVKVQLKRCGGEVRLVLPANLGLETPGRQVPSLIKAVARAHNWYGRIIRGELTGSGSIAKATGLDQRYVRRILKLAFLAPAIMECILEGRQPAKMTLQNCHARLPIEWAAQHQILDISGR